MRTFRTPEEVAEVTQRYWVENSYTFGVWSFCYPTRLVRWPGHEVRITEMEADMLKVLLDAYPAPLKGGAMAAQWTAASGCRMDYLNVKTYVARLRKKLGGDVIFSDGSRGAGYVFNAAVGFGGVVSQVDNSSIGDPA